jgi:hypothetical protein
MNTIIVVQAAQLRYVLHFPPRLLHDPADPVIDCSGAISLLNYFLVSRSKRYSASSILITSGLSLVAGRSDSLPWKDGVQQIVLRFDTLLPCGLIHGP